MRIKKSELTYLILVFYPFINILVCYLFKGDMMNITSVAFCLLIMLVNYGVSNRIQKKEVVIIGILIIAVVLSFFREVKFSNKVISILYAVTTLFFVMCYSRRIDILALKKMLIHRPRLFFGGQIAFLVVLFIHFLQNGLTYGWNTVVLQGPYNYPHTLAYLLLFMLCGNLILFIRKTEFKSMCLAGLDAILIVLTAVRSACVALAIIALFVLWFYLSNKHYKKVLIIVALGLIALITAFNYGLFDSFIAKTNLSVQGGYGYTNNRSKTFISSIETFNYYGQLPLNIVFGTGLEALCEHNGVVLGDPIHAHNDFLDILVSYGLPCLIVYLYVFFKSCMMNTKHFWLIFMLGVLSFYNGLFTYIDCIPLIVWPILLFNFCFTEKNA